MWPEVAWMANLRHCSWSLGRRRRLCRGKTTSSNLIASHAKLIHEAALFVCKFTVRVRAASKLCEEFPVALE
eukprot:4315902-Amphidinium_carterae.1